MIRLFITITVALLSPLTAQSGVVGGGNGGTSLKLSEEELTELNVILQEQEVAYLETEFKTFLIFQKLNTLKAIDYDTSEPIEISY